MKRYCALVHYTVYIGVKDLPLRSFAEKKGKRFGLLVKKRQPYDAILANMDLRAPSDTENCRPFGDKGRSLEKALG